ncbi:hypothetical protein P3T73_14490 [Kiritimatiellota bacterium B12222]|nr:hypothetical protein P3T73_14490 [Kiritimatiellota bacterium B12222]
MSLPGKDQLEKQSLMLMSATMVGHVGNYAYHLITGRLLSETEYGLLMALFGMINLVLIPMSALGLSLTRAVSVNVETYQGGGVRQLTRHWGIGMGITALALFGVAYSFASPLQSSFGFNRLAPILLAACIPGLNLFLTLTGSLLQGLQNFKGLALRGSLLFILRALLVAACLLLGWKAAGWALLAHLLGMAGALSLSLFILYRHFPRSSNDPCPAPSPILRQALETLPVLLAFSTLMTADVILARKYFGEHLSGQFAQAATLGRMVLWLPLPIAQVMFPKVVRNGQASPAQRKILFKAFGYTLLLVTLTLIVGCLFAPLGLKMVYGIATPSASQIAWFRGTALAMALLGPVYLLLQYELARGHIKKLLPLCLLAPVFPIGVYFYHPDPSSMVRILISLNALALLSGLWVLKKETVPQLDPLRNRHSKQSPLA